MIYDDGGHDDDYNDDDDPGGIWRIKWWIVKELRGNVDRSLRFTQNAKNSGQDFHDLICYPSFMRIAPNRTGLTSWRKY